MQGGGMPVCRFSDLLILDSGRGAVDKSSKERKAITA